MHLRKSRLLVLISGFSFLCSELGGAVMTDTFHGALLAAAAYTLFSAIEVHPVHIKWDRKSLAPVNRP
jgi:hypothetical protein